MSQVVVMMLKIIRGAYEDTPLIILPVNIECVCVNVVWSHTPRNRNNLYVTFVNLSFSQSGI